jgi:hypothetical protein
MLDKDFIIPARVQVGKKVFALNLNGYRNAHFQTLNNAKKIFKNQLYADYPELFKIRAQSVIVQYKITPHNNRLFDTQNIVSIVDKFFLDALVEAGTIPDDNYKIVTYHAPIVAPVDSSLSDIIITAFCEFY